MECLCFGKRAKKNSENGNPTPKPISTSSKTLQDKHRSSRSSASVQVEASKVPLIGQLGWFPLVPNPTQTKGRDKYDFDIIAIHGLNGHPHTTWSSKSPQGESEMFWLRDLLPKALPGARVFTYGYDSSIYFSTSTGNIDSYALGLLNYLDVERSEAPQKSRPIIFICHSLGGLVCKQALVKANDTRERFQSILDSTKAIFFFGTPHRGSDVADVVHKVMRFLRPGNPAWIEPFTGKGKPVRTDIIKELRPESQYLKRLRQSFLERTSQIPCIVTFCEQNSHRGFEVVTEDSAWIGIQKERVVPLTGDHMEICRIKGENEMAFKIIVQECRKLSMDAFGRPRPMNVTEQQCMDSLADPNFKDALNPRKDPARHTCEWIFSDQQFKAWLNGLPPLLWISGQFGCGKTTLMSFMRQRMTEDDTMEENAELDIISVPPVGSFFCDERNRHLTSATSILQGLILDIVSQDHELIRHALKHFEASRAWSYKKLWQTFESILDDERLSGICIIIDALDECERKEMVKLLGDITTYLRRKSNPENTITFVLSSTSALTARLDDLEQHASHFRLDEDEHLQQHIAADIRQFVRDDLMSDGDLFSRDNSSRSLSIDILTNMIVARSEGSFLWTSLVLEEIHAKFFSKLAAVEEFIQKCPLDLHGVYYSSLVKVDPPDYPTVRKSLHIILAARKPLTLEEFKTAMGIEKQHRTLASLQSSVEENDHLLSYLGRILGALLRIDGSRITLRHQSVRDFLLNGLGSRRTLIGDPSHEYSSDLRSAFHMTMADAEKTMAGCCINLLNFEDYDHDVAHEGSGDLWEELGFGAISRSTESLPRSAKSNGRPASHDDSQPKTPFYDYAASYWGFHYASSDSTDEELMSRALGLSMKGNTRAKWLHRYRRSYWGCHNLPEHLDAMTVAAYFGQVQVIAKLTSEGKLRSNWSRALTWAARMGHADIVRLLLNLGVPCMGESVEGRPAFSWAVAGGFLDITKMLLTCDEDLVNIQDADRCCPLTLAVQNQHLEVVEMLLDSRKIDVNLKDKSGASPFLYAVSGSNPLLVEMNILRKLLRDVRVDITLRDKRGRSCLSWLAEYGVTNAIQEILHCTKQQRAIDKLLDDPGDNAGVSPLSHAAFMGHTETVRLLCETKRVQSQLESVDNLDGANVFDRAAKRGHANVIEELGKHYPEGVDFRDATGRTPLSTAMWNSNEDVLRNLIKCGADVNLPDFGGRAPVSHGVERINLIRLLVEEYGADINRPDNDGHTPLWWARTGSEEVQSKLRDMGAR